MRRDFFDLLLPFKECRLVVCKTLGDLAVSTNIGEYPTVQNKPSNQSFKTKTKKKNKGRKGHQGMMMLEGKGWMMLKRWLGYLIKKKGNELKRSNK